MAVAADPLAGATALLVAAVASRPRPMRGRTLRAWLEDAGCDVVETVAPSPDDLDAAVSALAGAHHFDDAVVVLVEPGGPDLVAALRGCTDLPVVVVDDPARLGLEAALDAGADDYAALPLRPAELLARIRAHLRRRRREAGRLRSPTSRVTTPDFDLDIATRQARTPDGPVHLTPTEWRLVRVLVRRPDTVVSHDELVTAIWGSPGPGRVHSLRVHLGAVRAKLEPDPGDPVYFRTEQGAGLWFAARGDR